MRCKKLIFFSLIVIVGIIIGHLSTYKVANEIEQDLLNRYTIYFTYYPGEQNAASERSKRKQEECEYDIDCILVPEKELFRNLAVYFNICARHCSSESDKIWADVVPLFTIYWPSRKTAYVKYSYSVEDKDGNIKCGAWDYVFRIRYVWRGKEWVIEDAMDISAP